ncbi:MAG: hypothetical protein IH987_09605 [Planctomycetes bacterium]|nr:hypothetical protein [Planctomycetota bacterium]
MLTNVGLYHEPQRKRPWLVCWWGPPDPDTHRQRKSTKTFRYVRDARVFQAQKRSELAKSGGVDRKQCTVALQQLIDEFKAARLPNLGPSTKSGYENTLTQLIDHFGPTRDIRTIEGRHCETFMANRKRQKGASKPLASWTRARHVINARALINAGMAWGYVDRNPFSAPRGRGSSPLRVNAKSRPWPHVTPEEFRRFLAVIPNARQRAAYWCMFGCGLRAGEVYGLTADCIDLERRRIHVVNRAATEDVPPFTIKADGQATESKERHRSASATDSEIPHLHAKNRVFGIGLQKQNQHRNCRTISTELPVPDLGQRSF